MKKPLIFNKLLGFILATVAAFTITSCSKKTTFLSSSTVPAAVGTVKIKVDKNKNHTIQVKVNNLATANQLTPPKKTYVVWMTTETTDPQNIGQLRSTNSLLSSALKASLNAVTSLNPISFFITAEDQGDVQTPGTLILSTR
jgi:hypothetical protein